MSPISKWGGGHRRYTRLIRWSEIAIDERHFAPRRNPLPAPAPGIFDFPYACVTINQSWASHIIGVLEPLTQRDAWAGSTPEVQRAQQEIEKLLELLSKMCEDPCVMPEQFCCDETNELLTDIKALLGQMVTGQKKSNIVQNNTNNFMIQQRAADLRALDDGTDPRSFAPDAPINFDTDPTDTSMEQIIKRSNGLCSAVGSYVQEAIRGAISGYDSQTALYIGIDIALAAAAVVFPPAAAGLVLFGPLAFESAYKKAALTDPQAIQDAICCMVAGLQGKEISFENFKGAMNGGNDCGFGATGNSAIVAGEIDQVWNSNPDNYRLFVAALGASANASSGTQELCPCGCDSAVIVVADGMDGFTGQSVTYRGVETHNIGGTDYDVDVYRLRSGIKPSPDIAGRIEVAAGLKIISGNDCCSIISVGSGGSGGIVFVENLGNTVTFCDGTTAFNPAGGAIEGCIRQAISKIRVSDTQEIRDIIATQYTDFAIDPTTVCP